jgi:predicted membrane protein
VLHKCNIIENKITQKAFQIKYLNISPINYPSSPRTKAISPNNFLIRLLLNLSLDINFKIMRKENQYKKSNNSSLLGLLIILFGILLLIDNVIPGLHFFNRLFSWPIILIACGLIIGHTSRYENPASYILILIGAFFLVLKLFNINFNMLFWPIILIAIGFTLITSRTRRNRFRAQPIPPKEPIWDKRVFDESEISKGNESTKEDSSEVQMGVHASTEERTEYNDNKNNKDFKGTSYSKDKDFNGDEFVDSTSVFSSNKINVVSRNFKGGNVVNIFAGTEINLMHADMNEPAVLEVVQLFGGSTVIAPAHWVIQPEMAAIFGGIEDKRFTNSMPDSSKVLYIRGTSLFGGITIKSV